MVKLFLPLLALLYLAGFAHAQDTASIDQSQSLPTLALANAADQERCITIMTGFPDANYQERYQFFRLIEDMGAGATPAFRGALAKYGQGDIAPDAPVTAVIEAISNPVLRQAAPEIAIAQMAHLIEFSRICEAFIAGQVGSLEAYDTALGTADFNTVIGEDALFLRQVVTDALFRLEADKDPVHANAILAYSRSLVTARNNIEFNSFESEVDEIEALFLSDLDGRLARSNDIINNDLNPENTSSALALTRDLNSSTREQAQRQRQENMLRIFRIFQ